MWNRSILIARTWIVLNILNQIIWIKLSGSNYLDQIIWIKLSGSYSLDQIVWIKLSGSNSLDQIVWIKLSGSNYLDQIIWIKLSGSNYLVQIIWIKLFWILWIILNHSELFSYKFLYNFHIKFILIFISIYPLFNANYWSLNPDKNPLILINFKENFENVPTFQLYLHV